MSTAVDLELDLELLVGEMEAPPCESTSHDPLADPMAHDDGPATHYVRLHDVGGCGLHIVKAYCGQFIQYILADLDLQCSCGHRTPASEVATILGPINS